MLKHALRIVIAAAIGACLTGALATGASADPAGQKKALPLAGSWTHSLRSASSPDLAPPHAASYRLDADTGPPTPGPTDPNGPAS